MRGCAGWLSQRPWYRSKIFGPLAMHPIALSIALTDGDH